MVVRQAYMDSTKNKKKTDYVKAASDVAHKIYDKMEKGYQKDLQNILKSQEKFFAAQLYPQDGVYVLAANPALPKQKMSSPYHTASNWVDPNVSNNQPLSKVKQPQYSSQSNFVPPVENEIYLGDRTHLINSEEKSSLKNAKDVRQPEPNGSQSSETEGLNNSSVSDTLPQETYSPSDDGSDTPVLDDRGSPSGLMNSQEGVSAQSPGDVNQLESDGSQSSETEGLNNSSVSDTLPQETYSPPDYGSVSDSDYSRAPPPEAYTPQEDVSSQSPGDVHQPESDDSESSETEDLNNSSVSDTLPQETYSPPDYGSVSDSDYSRVPPPEAYTPQEGVSSESGDEVPLTEPNGSQSSETEGLNNSSEPNIPPPETYSPSNYRGADVEVEVANLNDSIKTLPNDNLVTGNFVAVKPFAAQNTTSDESKNFTVIIQSLENFKTLSENEQGMIRDRLNDAVRQAYKNIIFYEGPLAAGNVRPVLKNLLKNDEKVSAIYDYIRDRVDTDNLLGISVEEMTNALLNYYTVVSR
jgi:hypothetical protein